MSLPLAQPDKKGIAMNESSTIRLTLRSLSMGGEPAGEDVYTGESFVAIVLSIQERSPFMAHLSVEEYLDRLSHIGGEISGKKLEAAGATPEERATSLFQALASVGLAKIERLK